MPRLQHGPGDYDLVLKPGQVTQVGLVLDRTGKGLVQIQTRYIPLLEGQDPGGLHIHSWEWANGPAGAGYSRETPQSKAGGGSAVGEFVWLRRDGVSQTAGELVEIPLDATLAALTAGSFIDAFTWTDGSLFLTTNTRYMAAINGGIASSCTTAADFGAGNTTIGAKIFKGTGSKRAYVGCGNQPIQEFTGAAWVAGDADTKCRFMDSVYWNVGPQLATGGMTGTGGTGAPHLVMAASTGTGDGFYHTTGDPKSFSAWSALTVVGSDGEAVNSLAASARTVWYGKATGVFGVEALGYSPNFTKWYEYAYSPANGNVMAYWGGAIWSAHQQGLMMVPIDGSRQDIALSVQFGRSQSNTTSIYGRPVALAPSPEGLMVAYYDPISGTSYVGCLKFTNGAIRWSMAECVIPNRQVTFLRYASPSTGPRLYIGTVDPNGALHLYYQYQPSSGDPEQDYLVGGPMKFAQESSLTLSRFGAGGGVPMTFRGFRTEADNLGGGNVIDFKVASDGGAAVTQGTATASPSWSSDPISGSIRATSGQVTLDIRNSRDVPVIVRNVSTYYSSHPDLTKVKTYPILLGENLINKHGTHIRANPKNDLSLLEHAQNEGPIEIIDELGRTIEGVIEPGFNEVVTDEGNDQGFSVRCQVTISTSLDPARWDESDFDVGETFG